MQYKYTYINENGCSIHCKIYYNDLHAVKRVVICLHGFTGHMDNKAVERFADCVLKRNKDVAVLQNRGAVRLRKQLRRLPVPEIPLRARQSLPQAGAALSCGEYV